MDSSTNHGVVVQKKQLTVQLSAQGALTGAVRTTRPWYQKQVLSLDHMLVSSSLLSPTYYSLPVHMFPCLSQNLNSQLTLKIQSDFLRSAESSGMFSGIFICSTLKPSMWWSRPGLNSPLLSSGAHGQSGHVVRALGMSDGKMSDSAWIENEAIASTRNISGIYHVLTFKLRI